MKDTYTKEEVIILLAAYADEVQNKPIEQSKEVQVYNLQRAYKFLDDYSDYLERFGNILCY